MKKASPPRQNGQKSPELNLWGFYLLAFRLTRLLVRIHFLIGLIDILIERFLVIRYDSITNARFDWESNAVSCCDTF